MITTEIKDLLKIYEDFAVPFMERLVQYQESLDKVRDESKENLALDVSDNELVQVYTMLQDFYISGTHHQIGNKLRDIRQIAFSASSRRIHWNVDVTKTGNIRQPQSMEAMASRLTPEEKEMLVKLLQQSK